MKFSRECSTRNTHQTTSQVDLVTAASTDGDLCPSLVSGLCLGNLLGRKSERNLLVRVRRDMVDHRLGHDRGLATNENETDPALLISPALVPPCKPPVHTRFGWSEAVSAK